MQFEDDISVKIRQLTQVGTSGLCPEISLHQVPEDETFAAFHENHSAIFGAAPPYWAVPWPGGQALARYVLDNPETAKDCAAIDLGAGGGIAAIAAAQVGAARVTAIDSDVAARAAIQANARLNDVELAQIASRADALLSMEPELLLVGDLWYEATTARYITTLLGNLVERGFTIIVGDLNRAHFPIRRVELLQDYCVPVSDEFERSSMARTGVYRFVA